MSNTSHIDLFATLQSALAPQYRLERELGRGGMGVVFLATDTTLDRPVAVKVIHPELAAHESIARRFLAEARMIARLRHPNIVAIHAAGDIEGLLYYVMDEVAGESLRQRLMREGRLSAEETARIVADLAAALHTAGRAGFVHRDVKPENVLLDETTGRAMLADFGIARAMVASDAGPNTGQGIAVGTPAYMSPEQAAGEEIDIRSDLYALGVVAYEMLAGQPPFQGPNRVVVSKHIAERPTPIERVRPDCPPALAAAVMRALEKAPADRWQTGEEFREAVLGTRAPGTARGRRVLVAAAAALAIIGTSIGLARRDADAPPPGTNPRHSMLVLPFDNLRDDPAVEWLRDGSVSMLALNLSQWNDVTVIDGERLHDLFAQHELDAGDEIGLDMARRLARAAGVWTVVLGDYTSAGDSLHLVARVYDVASGQRVDVVRVDAVPGEDVRPLFDALAAQLLDLSGAPDEIRTGLAQATTESLEAFRSYLRGVDLLNRWDLAAAARELGRATALDTTFALAYYKLALTRGWIVGVRDSIADRAILRASLYAGKLPQHDRTVVAAYRAFLQQEYAPARALYQELLARNPGDADAWYGLGDAWFHDESGDWALSRTHAIRAFKRALTLDPSYALAYDHIQVMLADASQARPVLAYFPGDSFALARKGFEPLLDSATVARGVQRARTEGVAQARRWVANQPTTIRAHTAMVSALVAAGDYPAALAEVDRFGALPSAHPEERFIRARIHFAAGDVDLAATQLREALDSVAPQDFLPYAGTPSVLSEVEAAANVFAYQGDLGQAVKAIDLADRVRREVFEVVGMHKDSPVDGHWKRAALADLYAAAGAPTAVLRQLWQSAAEAGRSVPPSERAHYAHSGAAAALGLFTGLAADTSAIVELEAMTGERPVKEIRALLALSRQDSVAARRALNEPDTVFKRPMYTIWFRPLAAQAYHLLGEHEQALRMLQPIRQEELPTGRFDMRWGLLGRVRLLRGAVYERLGRPREARQEYEAVLAQWKQADEALQPYVQQARQGVARLNAPRSS